MPIPEIEIQDVTFTHNGEKDILLNASLQIERGALIRLTGASGTGKSTVLKLLCRLLEPEKGRILLEGTPYTDIEPQFLRRKISYVQQSPTIIPGTLRDNLLLPFSFAANKDLRPAEDSQLNNYLQRFFPEKVILEQDAEKLSVGQKQRLCLLRSLLLKPAVMLLDEPTSALDPENSEMVNDLTLSLNREEGVTIILVTHNNFDYDKAALIEVELKNGKAVIK